MRISGLNFGLLVNWFTGLRLTSPVCPVCRQAGDRQVYGLRPASRGWFVICGMWYRVYSLR